MIPAPIIAAGAARIPALGLGTWALRGWTAQSMVEAAIEIGYRHIDTASMYANETEVGAGIAASGIERDALFVTTKVWPDRFAYGELQASADESLKRLGLDHVDLLLLHWPSREVPLAETLRALDEVAADGRATHVGVSNFTAAGLAEALALSKAGLVCNQVEYHPQLDQRAVLAATRANDMALVAYSPLARGDLAADRTLARIGRAHGKSASQVTLRWLVQQPGVSAIPRTSNPGRARTNFEIFDFELSTDEMASISRLAVPGGRRTDPDGLAPDWD